MNINFTGKNIMVSDAIKERAMSKIGKLDKHVNKELNVNIKFSAVKQEHKVEVTIPMHRRVLRAETVSADFFSAIDSVSDILEKQLIKYKAQLIHKNRRDSSYHDEVNAVIMPTESIEENEVVIEKTKRFALKPMDAEEAAMEMELLGHNFYVFKNGLTEEVNVVYKRSNGSYGLIEPEF